MNDRAQRINTKRARHELLLNLFTWASIVFWIVVGMWVVGFIVGTKVLS